MSGLYRLYIAHIATPSEVLETLEEPTAASVGEQRVFKYLQKFIGHMKIDEVQNFVTGSSVCMSQPIKVTLNRCHMSHVQDCVSAGVPFLFFPLCGLS